MTIAEIDPETSAPSLDDPPPSLGERCLTWALAELAASTGGRPTDDRITWYFSACVRNGKPLRGLGPKDNWCAASACATAAACLLPGEQLPHAYRASGLELVADAQASGAWHGVAESRSQKWLPRTGDLAIFQRGQPGQATAWERHVARVLVPPDGSGKLRTIGGNEGPTSIWKQTDHALTDADLLGFIAYPQAPDPAGPATP